MKPLNEYLLKDVAGFVHADFLNHELQKRARLFAACAGRITEKRIRDKWIQDELRGLLATCANLEDGDALCEWYDVESLCDYLGVPNRPKMEDYGELCKAGTRLLRYCFDSLGGYKFYEGSELLEWRGIMDLDFIPGGQPKKEPTEDPAEGTYCFLLNKERAKELYDELNQMRLIECDEYSFMWVFADDERDTEHKPKPIIWKGSASELALLGMVAEKQAIRDGCKTLLNITAKKTTGLFCNPKGKDLSNDAFSKKKSEVNNKEVDLRDKPFISIAKIKCLEEGFEKFVESKQKRGHEKFV